eukprot:GHVN01034459.1.p1 GENE.GHVN01034459.1~~GHVN01034459.1.p1  ORF type:complete len:899 (+),score=57.45 GHVN01034459.1:431-3127(+)
MDQSRSVEGDQSSPPLRPLSPFFEGKRESEPQHHSSPPCASVVSHTASSQTWGVGARYESKNSLNCLASRAQGHKTRETTRNNEDPSAQTPLIWPPQLLDSPTGLVGHSSVAISCLNEIVTPEDQKRLDILFKRRFTDKAWFAFVVLCIVGLIHINVMAMWWGDPRRLYHGYNYKGELCGVDPGVVDFGLLYWPINPDTASIDPYTPLCVDRCFTREDEFANTTVLYPLRDVTSKPLSSDSHVRSVDVTVTMVHSRVIATSQFVAGPYCLPNNSQLMTLTAAASGLTGGWNVACRAVRSLWSGWYWMLMMAVFTIVACFAHLRVVRATSTALKTVVWVLLITTPALFILSGVALLAYGFSGIVGSGGNTDKVEAMLHVLTGHLDMFALWSGGAFIIVGLLTASAAVSIAPSIRTATSVVEMAADCFWDMPRISVGYSVVGVVLSGATAAYWVVGLVYLASQLTQPPDPSALPDAVIGSPLSFHGIRRDFVMSRPVLLQMVLWSMGMGLMMELVAVWVKFVTAMSVAFWYFTVPDTNGVRHNIVSKLGTHCAWTALRYHLGTLTCAAVYQTFFKGLAALVAFFRKRLQYFEKESGGVITNGSLTAALRSQIILTTSPMGMESLTSSLVGNGETLGYGPASSRLRGGRVLGFLSSLTSCCVTCLGTPLCGAVLSLCQFIVSVLESFARYSSTICLIECAMHSTSYDEGCFEANRRLADDGPSVQLLSGFTSLISFCVTSSLSIVVGVLTYSLLANLPMLTDPSSPWAIDIPLVLAGVICTQSAACASILLGNFDLIADTLFHCILSEKDKRSRFQPAYPVGVTQAGQTPSSFSSYHPIKGQDEATPTPFDDVMCCPESLRSLVAENEAEFQLFKEYAEMEMQDRLVAERGGSMAVEILKW